jgi:hypothetical protein
MKNLKAQRPTAGFSLVLVLITVGICFLLLAGVLLWSSNSGQISLRQSEHCACLAAAEAATEKVVAQLSSDFRSGGRDSVDAKLGTYQTLVPSALENAAWWGSYDFLDSAGTPGRLEVGRLSDWQYGPLNWRAGTLSGHSATYGILATARNRASGNNVRAAVRQELQVAAIPLSTEFFMFSALDLELNPGSGDWVVNGPVHGNANIYCSPGVAVTFQNFVTAAGEILHERAPGDPVSPGGGSVTYAMGKESEAGSLRVPIEGLPSNPAELWAVCSNQADLKIIMLSATNLVAYNAINGPVSTNLIWGFVRTTNTDASDQWYTTDKREHDDTPIGEVTPITEFDVAAFTTNLTALAIALGKVPATVYIADARPTNAYATFYSIKLVNGQVLPPGGLTLATPNPLYVQGNFNAPAPSTTNGAQPACLIADAVTVLSSRWRNIWGHGPLAGRPATNTTVNASVVMGIVPTREGSYSGGMENSLRLLEDWSGCHLYFNGSLAVLFTSQIAVGEWGRPDVYNPPYRVFRYAPSVGGAPLLTSLELQSVSRAAWRTAQPGTTL